MALPRIGQNIYLDVRSEALKGRYQCRVMDSGPTSLFIEIPMRINAPIPVTFDVGVEFEVIYRALDGAECRFFSKVLNRVVRELPVLEIAKPKSNEITRIQRREYLRVPVTEQVEFSFQDAVTRKLVNSKGLTRDISGGGMAFFVDPSVPIRPEDTVSFTLQLPNDPNAITAKGVVLRVLDMTDQNGKMVVSIRFTDITDQNRQRIVKFTFSRQIEISKKLGD
jgi:c-di-GMP-binding flagellar brake protein YcgR